MVIAIHVSIFNLTIFAGLQSDIQVFAGTGEKLST